MIPEELLELGKQKADAQDFLGAIADFNRAIEINPDYAEAYEYRGHAYFILENPEKAISDLTQAIEINPNKAEVFRFRAFYQISVNKVSESLADCNQAILIDLTA